MNIILLQKKQACRICGAFGDFRTFTAREMMFGYKEEFEYFQCSSCGSLGISDVPDNLGNFYPENYYSYGKKTDIVHRIRLMLDLAVANPKFSDLALFLAQAAEVDFSVFKELFNYNVQKNSPILDVGSGSGGLLYRFSRIGYTNLTGVDPYLPADSSSMVVRLVKGDISKLPAFERFSFIIFKHSLEHVTDPYVALQAAKSRLKDDGIIYVAVPIVNFAYEKYGANWYQLDAPRHLNLFSNAGIRILARRTGLSIVKSYFNSNSTQFTISEKYFNNESMFLDGKSTLGGFWKNAGKLISPRQFSYRRASARLNSEGRGDMGVFLLVHENWDTSMS